MSLEGHKAGKENPIATYILVTRVNYCSVLKENSKHFAFFPISSERENKEIEAILSELCSSDF